LKIRRELGDKQGIAELLSNLGEIAEVEGDSEQAIFFILHATRLHKEMKSASNAEAKEIQEILADFQEKISNEQFERIKKQAEAMSIDEVVGLALLGEGKARCIFPHIQDIVDLDICGSAL
jgi:rubrerythrin